MYEIKDKPKIDFTRNKLLQKIFNNYAQTFALTLDTIDFIEKKHLNKFRSYVWKDMRKNLRKVPSIARKQKQFVKMQLKLQLKQIEDDKRNNQGKIKKICFLKRVKDFSLVGRFSYRAFQFVRSSS